VSGHRYHIARRPQPLADVAPAGARRDPMVAWSRAWLAVVGLAVVNGALHRGYEPLLGVLPAHQLSGLLLVLLVLGWAGHVQRRHPLTTTYGALRVGAAWAALTVAFEFGFFHYVGGTPWATLLHDYDLTAGRVWALVVLGIALAPALARRLDDRKSPRPHAVTP
jgi:hypothetical protein